ncbi:MAG: class I SAM-dependent methyltransferase [Verrucomicrobia bacterium]|nr:class I SAM-dependent methyltransferase [Verrucomicrobiota bacterium]
MKEHEKQAAVDRYNKRISEMGPTVQAIGWGDERQQKLRFAVLTAMGEMNGRSILDVGCGFGDMIDYLKNRGLDVEYTGVDINPAILEVARERHPDARFECRDIVTAPFDEQFDYVFQSGAFNHRVEDNREFVWSMMQEMYRLCRRGMAFNLLTSYVDYQDDSLFYFRPEDYLPLAKKLSRYVTLRHDYPLYEFTLQIFREPPEYGRF